MGLLARGKRPGEDRNRLGETDGGEISNGDGGQGGSQGKNVVGELEAG